LARHATQDPAAVAPTVVRYVPAEQSEHPTEPLTSLYLPATQAVHVPLIASLIFAYVNPALQVQSNAVVLELGAFEFEGQVEHVDEALAPTAAEYVPVPQSVHAALPLLVLYLPATHVEQTPPFGPEDPTLQVQVVLDAAEFEFTGQTTHAEEAVAPTVTENVPPEQSEQAPDPLKSLYLPATHAVHVPPFAPVNPALHKQAAITVLETGAFEFTEHATHVDEALAPTAAEYVAAPQSVQATLPALVLYFPATHNSQAPGSPLLPGGQSNSHAVLAATETPPAAHAVHALAPAVAEKVPATQSVQTTLPLLVLYLPATHPEHTPPSAPVNPALQVQAAMTELDTAEFEFTGQLTQLEIAVAPAATEYEPTPQSVHVTLPLLVLYLPATHPEHTPPFAPVYPALQEQPAIAELDTAEFEFTGQAKHVDAALAPTVAE
jgi:hypothetical protein